MKKTIPLDSRKAGALILVLVLGLATEVANADYTFGEPTNLGPPINTPSREVGLFISADGLEMYISSERSGGLGYIDMWRSTRENADNPWGPLVNVQEINSRYNESFPCLSADGLTLYFSDWYGGGWSAAGDRPGGVGSGDLWMCTRASRNDPWAAPVNMGPAVNSSAYDGDGCLSTDGLALFFCSDRPGGRGSYDIWMTTRRSQAAAWSPPVNLGPVINTSGMEGIPSLSPDQKTLYGGIGGGGWDVYEVPIVPIVDLNSDGIVDADDMCIMVDYWGTDEPLCDIGPMPWGDGVVDVQDLIVLSEHLFEEDPSAEPVE